MYQTDILYEYHVWIYRGRGEGCPALTVLILFIHKLIEGPDPLETHKFYRLL